MMPYLPAMASPQELLKAITTGKYKSLYYFWGSEDYRMVEAEKFFAKQYIPGPQLTSNYRRIDARKTPSNELLALLSSYPMLGERQLFVVVDPQGIKGGDLERFLKLVATPDPSRINILSTPSARMPRKDAKFLTEMKKIAEVVEFHKLTETETRDQVVSRLKKEGIAIDKKGLDLLTTLVAGNKGALDNETAKLAQYVGSGMITENDVKTICSSYEVTGMFELGDILVRGDVAATLKAVRNLFSEGLPATYLVTLLINHFQMLYLVRSQKPLPSNRRFLQYRLAPQAAKFSVNRLEKALTLLAEADADLRKSKMPPDMTVEVLAMRLSETR